MADVFISYARPQASAARRVADMLRADGYSVWFDQDLQPHRAYADMIEERLDNASAVVVLWSRDAVKSQWVRSEAERARESGRLVQLRLDDSRLPMPFDQIQCADLSRWRGNPGAPPWSNVLASIAALARSDTAGATAPARPTPYVLTRRRVLAGSATVAAVGVAGFALWRATAPDPPSAEAMLLFEKGTDALQANDAFDPGDPAAAAQAVAFLSDATRVEPDFAAAWGALALAYAVRRKGAPPAERAGLESRSRSAARRALDLDPGDARAVGALRLLEPVYRHWLAAERASREALKVHPEMPLLIFLLADVLGSVGRWREAARLALRLDRGRYLIAGADRQLIVNLWSAGDLSAADEAVRKAIDHWPRHPQIWQTRAAFLMHSGRPAEALALIRDPSERPPVIIPGMVEALAATASALAGEGNAGEAVERHLALLKRDPALIFTAAHAASALGRPDTTLALLTGYYFGDGKWAGLAPAGGDQDRQTAPLFHPPMRRLWTTPAFIAVLERIGLRDYWRTSGTKPDFLPTG